MILGFRCWALCCLLLASLSARAETPTPLEWLERMAEAGSALNYSGSFTYEHSASMESFRLVHWVDGDQTHEYLEYLNGPAQSHQRLGSLNDCRTVGLTLLQGGEGELGQSADIDQYYQLQFRGQERIAGRPAQMLEVRPRDQLRYGYLLGIDRDTGLLLKSVLVDEQQRVLERFQFVELDVDPDVESLKARLEEGDAIQRRPLDCAPELSRSPSRWTLNWVPPGFVYSGERLLADNIEMLMYTDGLASFSVFLQPVAEEPRVEGRAQRGATSAYMGRLVLEDESDSHDPDVRGRSDYGDAYRVTVVGEIPVPVAEQLARGINTLEASARPQ